MSPNSVAFRVDASAVIGHGHVMRCLALAAELRSVGCDSTFLCREDAGHLGDRIRADGHAVRFLPMRREAASLGALGETATEWSEDALATRSLLTEVRASLLVLDHYSIDARWERMVAHAGRTLVIDDLADRDHECDFLLDQNIGRNASDYRHRVGVRTGLLIGPEYALLRREFSASRAARTACRNHAAAGRILVCFGGTDFGALTGRVLGVLNRMGLPDSICVEVVLGAAAPTLEDVRQAVAESRYRCLLHVDPHSMAGVMMACDVAIGGCGVSALERCCLGIPSLAVVQAENQRAGAAALGLSGSSIIVESTEILEAACIEFITELVDRRLPLTEMSRSATAICDGLGAQRVVKLLLA